MQNSAACLKRAESASLDLNKCCFHLKSTAARNAKRCVYTPANSQTAAQCSKAARGKIEVIDVGFFNEMTAEYEFKMK